MPTNKYALLRYRIIDDCITNKYRPYPTIEDMMDACEQALYGSSGEHISKSTIEKDIRAMKNEGDLGFYAPIVYSKLEKGYYYSEPDYTIKEISLNHEEKEAIRFAATTLFQFKDLSIFDQFGSAIQKIFDRLNISPEMQDEAIERYVQFESTPVAKGSDLLPLILSSIKDTRSIHFTYKSFQDDSTSHRHLQPYLLKEYRNRWYVIGKDVDQDKIRTFGLDRISDLNTAGKLFDVDPKFDPDLLFKHSFGITAGGKPEKFVLRFAQLEGRYVRSQPLHPSQRIISDDNSGLTLSIKVIPSYELRSTILSFGDKVEVLEGTLPK